MIDTANNNMNEKIWDNTLVLLESSVSKPIFDTWIKHASLILYSGEHIIIKVRNDFEKHMLENQHFNLIKNCLESVLNHSVKIKFVTPQEQEEAIEHLFQQQGYTKEDFQTEDTNNIPITQPAASISEPQSAAPNVIYDTFGNTINLNSKYTFDSFVVGNSNLMTHAACIGVAHNIVKERDRRIYGP